MADITLSSGKTIDLSKYGTSDVEEMKKNITMPKKIKTTPKTTTPVTPKKEKGLLQKGAENLVKYSPVGLSMQMGKTLKEEVPESVKQAKTDIQNISKGEVGEKPGLLGELFQTAEKSKERWDKAMTQEEGIGKIIRTGLIGLGTGGELVGEVGMAGLETLTPDKIQEDLMQKAEDFINTDTGKYIVKKAGQTVEGWNSFKQSAPENEELANKIEDLAKAGVVVLDFMGVGKGKQVVEKGLGKMDTLGKVDNMIPDVPTLGMTPPMKGMTPEIPGQIPSPMTPPGIPPKITAGEMLPGGFQKSASGITKGITDQPFQGTLPELKGMKGVKERIEMGDTEFIGRVGQEPIIQPLKKQTKGLDMKTTKEVKNKIDNLNTAFTPLQKVRNGKVIRPQEKIDKQWKTIIEDFKEKGVKPENMKEFKKAMETRQKEIYDVINPALEKSNIKVDLGDTLNEARSKLGKNAELLAPSEVKQIDGMIDRLSTQKSLSMKDLEELKQDINAITDWNASGKDKVFNNFLKDLSIKIGDKQDSILGKIEGDLSIKDLKTKYGSYSDMLSDVNKSIIKYERKKPEGLFSGIGKIAGLGNIVEGVVAGENKLQKIGKGLAQMGGAKYINTVNDANYMIKSTFGEGKISKLKKGLQKGVGLEDKTLKLTPKSIIPKPKKPILKEQLALPQKATITKKEAIITPQTKEKAIIEQSKKGLEKTKIGLITKSEEGEAYDFYNKGLKDLNDIEDIKQGIEEIKDLGLARGDTIIKKYKDKISGIEEMNKLGKLDKVEFIKEKYGESLINKFKDLYRYELSTKKTTSADKYSKVEFLKTDKAKSFYEEAKMYADENPWDDLSVQNIYDNIKDEVSKLDSMKTLGKTKPIEKTKIGTTSQGQGLTKKVVTQPEPTKKPLTAKKPTTLVNKVKEVKKEPIKVKKEIKQTKTDKKGLKPKNIEDTGKGLDDFGGTADSKFKLSSREIIGEGVGKKVYRLGRDGVLKVAKNEDGLMDIAIATKLDETGLIPKVLEKGDDYIRVKGVAQYNDLDKIDTGMIDDFIKDIKYIRKNFRGDKIDNPEVKEILKKYGWENLIEINKDPDMWGDIIEKVNLTVDEGKILSLDEGAFFGTNKQKYDFLNKTPKTKGLKPKK